MTRAKYKKRRLIKSLSIGAVCLLLTTVMIWASFVEAAVVTTNYTSYTVNFSSGKYVTSTVNADNTITYNEVAPNLFKDYVIYEGSNALQENASEGIILPATFAEVAEQQLKDGTNNTLNYKDYKHFGKACVYEAENNQPGNRLDVETFWFNNAWYSFTGWQIRGTTERLPGVTVFQPGDVIPVDTLAEYAKDGSLELDAIWGKCYFIQNGHTNMVYENYKHFDPSNTDEAVGTYGMYYCATCSTGATGATDVLDGVINNGSSPNVPMQTIENLFDQLWNDKQHQYDPYTTVVMLTGDLDLVKQRTMVTKSYTIDGVKKSLYPNIGHTNKPYETVIDNIWEHTFDYNVVHTLRFVGSEDGRRFAATYMAEAMTFKSLQADRTYDASAKTVTYTQNNGKQNTFYYKCYNDEGQFRGSMRFDNVNIEAKYNKVEWYQDDMDADGNVGKTDGIKETRYTAARGTAEANAAIAKYGTDVTPYFGDETVGRILRMYDGDKYNPNDPTNGYNGITQGGDCPTSYELTSRVVTPTCSNFFPFANFRCNQAEYIKISSGTHATLSYSWSDDADAQCEHDRYWYIGGSASASDMYLGSTQSEGDATVGYRGDAYVTVTGGFVGKICGTSITTSNAAPCVGNRYVRIYGDGGASGNRKYNPDVDYVFAGGSGADLVGNTYVVVRGATNIGDIYGGGIKGTAVVYGETDVYVANSTVNNVYGGGQYGNVEKNTSGVGGNITVKIVDSTVNKCVYGIGQGSTGYIDSTANYGAMYNDTEFMAEWVKPVTTYPTVNVDSSSKEFGFVTNLVKKQIGWASGSNGMAIGLNYKMLTRQYFLSPASAENVDIIIQNTTVSGDVYGGGKMSYVKGNTNVKITGSSYVGKWVCGGSEGGDTSTITDARVPIYQPPTTYVPASATITGSSAQITTPNDNGDENKLGNYSWSSETYLLGSSYNGIDHTKKLVYTPWVEQLGNVGGTTTVTVEGSANVNVVYGGGNAGDVAKLTKVNLTGGTVRSYIVSGCNKGTANGGTQLNISGGTVAGNVYGGGDYGTVNGDVAVKITGGTINSPQGLFGGGYQGSVNGNVALTITGGDINCHVYGGGNAGNVTKNITINVSGGDMTNLAEGSWDTGCRSFYGGGKSGDVSGNVTWNISGGRFGWIFGGGSSGDVKDITFNITPKDGVATPEKSQNAQPCVIGCFRGAGQSGAAEDVVINVSGGYYYRNFFCGPDGESAYCASTTLNADGGHFGSNIFGGGDTGDVKGNTSLTVGEKVRVYQGIFGGGDRAPSNIGGSTKVVVNGALIGIENADKGVYGGCSRGTVTGNTVVEINSTNGTLNFAHAGGYGGKYGTSTNNLDDDDYVWDLYGNIGGTATITVTGGTITDVFGGASGGTVGNANHNYTGGVYEGGHIAGTTVNIKGGTVTNVFGGGKAGGNVDGNATVNITGGTVGTVYGGNNAGGNVNGNTIVNISGGTVNINTLGGNNAGGTITGNTTVNLTSGTANYAYGGNYSSGTINGDTNVNLQGLTATDIFGGNLSGGVVGGTANVTLKSGTTGYAFGGNNADGTVAATNVQINGGSVAVSVFGGNLGGGTVTGQAKVTNVAGTFTANDSTANDRDTGVIFGGNFKGGTVGSVLLENNYTGGNLNNNDRNIFGGNSNGGIIQGDVVINNNKGYVYVIFGGSDVSGTILGDVTINVPAGASFNRAFGGGRNGGVIGAEGNPSKVTVNYNSPTAVWEVYGGSWLNGELYGTIEVNMTDGRIQNTIAGGGKEADITANTSAITVNITGGEIHRPNSADNTYHTGNGHVQGGCVSANCAVKPVVNIGTPGITGKIGFVRFVYGGCREGITTAGATVNIYDGLFQEIYGGSKINKGSDNLGDYVVNFHNGVAGRIVGGGYEGPTKGNTTVNLLGGTVDINAVAPTNMGNAKNQTKVSVIDTMVCGGGFNAKVTGDALVNMSGGSVATFVCGGGYNGAVDGNTNVDVSGGNVSQLLFGGGYNGAVSKNTYVNISGGSFGMDTTGHKNVYGGGYGASATVGGNTNMVISGGIFGWDIYGGGCSGAVKGDTFITIDGAMSANAVYGGGNEASVRNANVTITGAAEMKSLYGGGYNGNVTGNTVVSVSNGTYNGNVYGGGCNGDVDGDATFTISGGKFYGDTYGGGSDAPVKKNTYLTITGGQFGITNLKNVYGGGKGTGATVGLDTHVDITGGTFIWDVFGGGDAGAVIGDTYVTVSGATLPNSLYGGGNVASVKNANVEVSNARVRAIYGGGYQGVVTGNTNVDVSSSVITASVYGGGNEASVGDVSLTITGSTISNHIIGGGFGTAATAKSVLLSVSDATTAKNLYGGGFNGAVSGSVTVLVDGSTISDEFCGGGYGAAVGSVDLAITGATKLLGQNDCRVYGGGGDGVVNGNVNILIAGNGQDAPQITPNFYGGGKNAAVKGKVVLNITGGTFAKNVYGGGRNGQVGSTVVGVTDSGTAVATFSTGTNLVQIQGDLFGGGEGQTADVNESTVVIVDLDYGFTVTEQPITTDSITDSGEVKPYFVESAGEWSYIGGSVYGGGDLGRVGNGTIYNSGAASVTQAGSTTVEIRNGKIVGHVFAGGCGIPDDDNVAYNVYMGTVFGSTDLLINGGYIGGNVYGGGQQSRVYSAEPKNESVLASKVTILEVEGKKIAIGGSVFGGGDRGDSESANASVPTTIGNVLVTIKGIENKQPSDIFFLSGGIYGDGNLCLVDGTRMILMKDFEPSPDKTRVKTFYSLQRADRVTMDNSAVVLLGAIDLVEEGDTAVYSINRVGHLEMINGSVVKLDQIVKYLGNLTSDVHGADSSSPRKYIHMGNNGSNGPDGTGFTSMGCDGSCLDPLTVDLVNAYRNNSGNHNDEDKNVVCVANGLYLEIKGEDDEYGAVTGLFTLQLLRANPGEGGGFVYASIEESTGDFICETKEWVFAKADIANATEFENFSQQLYYREAGKAYKKATEFKAGVTYFYQVAQSEDTYMEIIDDVGGMEDGKYTYYYWYIGGPSVTYDVDVMGYIGTANTEFTADSNIPHHDDTYKYVLYGVDVNEILRSAVIGANKRFDLVQNANVTDKQIAIELRNGTTSLGFLYYDSTSNKWGMMVNGSPIYGNDGVPDASVAAANSLAQFKVDGTNDNLTWVLHKSVGISNTITNMEVYLDIDLYNADNAKVTVGTNVLSFSTSFSIIRLVPNQNLYHDSIRGFDGVGSTSNIFITGDSVFTAEYQTKYVPAAFPGAAITNMKWILSTQNRYYYACEQSFVTLDASGKIVAKSDDVNAASITGTVGSDAITVGDKVFTRTKSFESDNRIPANTKITMIDLSGTTPTYYYYICKDADGMETIDVTHFMQMGTTTKIADMATKPAFMTTYGSQIMEQVTERILFIFDFEQVDYANSNQFDGGVVFQHLFDGVDIMDHVKDNSVRANPKEVNYHLNPAESGVNGDTYTAEIVEESVSDIGTATLIVNADEHPNWVNTLFRENGYAFKVTLLDADNKPTAMPAGMYFEYKNQYFYPGRDSTFISVPVYEFGSHEITIHNPQFSLIDALGGNTAKYLVEFYSAPDANYYNSYNTLRTDGDSYTIVASVNSALKVDILPNVDTDADGVADVDNRVFTSGGTVRFKAYAKNADYAWIEMELYKKAEDGTYVKPDVEPVLTFNVDLSGGNSFAAKADGIELSFTVADAEPGTYRMMFRYGGHTEYLNFIVTG